MFHLGLHKYTVLKDTPGQTSDGEVEAEPMLSFFFKFFQCFSCIMFEPLISLVITDVGSRDLAKKAQVKLFRSLKSPSVKWLHLDLRK